MTSPMIAAKPASAPTVEMKWWIVRANGIAGMVKGGSLGSYTSTVVHRARDARAGQVRHVFRQRGRVTFQDEQVDLRERSLHPLGIKRVVAGALDPRRRRGLGVLVDVEQLLVELLPWLVADDLDGDVALGLQSRQPDHRPGELQDGHRL